MNSHMSWAAGVAGSAQADHVLQEEVRGEVYRRVAPHEMLPRLEQNREGVQRDIVALVGQILAERGVLLSPSARQDLEKNILAEILGFGPLQRLVDDPTVTEIMVNGPEQVWVERGGVLEKSDVFFADEQHVMRILHRIVDPVGRRIDLSTPAVNARLPNGSRVNAVIAPLALNGPAITIRKFREQRFELAELTQLGSLTEEVARYLVACVRGRLNILVSGGTGSGKTTLLNTLSTQISPNERIITIEDAAELQLAQPHVVRLEARPANLEGAGAFTIRDLVINALRMRPDRIIVGEVRGGETLDMLQAMNTGHDGSLTTAHANSASHAISRLETMFLMAGIDFPIRAIRRQIADAINIIVHQSRFADGSRRLTSVTEVLGMRGDDVELQDVFAISPDRDDLTLRYTGVRPRYIGRLRQTGVDLPGYLVGVN